MERYYDHSTGEMVTCEAVNNSRTVLKEVSRKAISFDSFMELVYGKVKTVAIIEKSKKTTSFTNSGHRTESGASVLDEWVSEKIIDVAVSVFSEEDYDLDAEMDKIIF